MIPVEHADLVPSLRVPYVHPAVRGATEHKLRIGAKTGLDRYPFIVQVTSKRLQRRAMKCVDQADRAAVRGDQDRLAVSAELQSCPVALLLLRQLERDKRPLIKAA